MLLGNFFLGSTIRLPLQITEEGGIPVTDASSVKIHKIIKPNGSDESGYPKDMKKVDSAYSVYYSDYNPQEIGTYIVIYTFIVDSVMFSAMDSFYITPPSSTAPYARSVSGKNPSAKSVASTRPTAKGL